MDCLCFIYLCYTDLQLVLIFAFSPYNAYTEYSWIQKIVAYIALFLLYNDDYLFHDMHASEIIMRFRI